MVRLCTNADGGFDWAALKALDTWASLDDMMDALAVLEVQRSWSTAAIANQEWKKQQN